MRRAKWAAVAVAVLAVLVVAAVLAKALGIGASRPERLAAAPRALTPDEARRAEERLLDEQTFSHPVNVAAPDVEVRTADGQRVRLSTLRGKVVLVNFWATWCPPCIQEMPSMIQLGSTLASAHPEAFQMVAVSSDDSWDAVRDYFAKNFGGIPKPLWVTWDPEAAAARAFYCTARGYCPDVKFPESYVVNRSGRIVAMMVGPRDWSDPGARQLLEFLIRG